MKTLHRIAVLCAALAATAAQAQVCTYDPLEECLEDAYNDLMDNYAQCAEANTDHTGTAYNLCIQSANDIYTQDRDICYDLHGQ